MGNRGRLEDLEDYVNAIADAELKKRGFSVTENAELFCNGCQQRRRMKVYRWFRKEHGVEALQTLDYWPNVKDRLREATPSCYGLICVQCDAHALAVIYPGPGAKPELAILRSTAGGLASPNAPAAVSYYLDQAMRSQSVGARSAAMSMYRAALEHLLFEQGFTRVMCGNKIADLETARSEGKAPRWADELDPDDLRVLKQLGDGAVHPNGGDLTRQDAVTSDLVTAVMAEFEKLLEIVYDRPAREKERREKIQAAAAQLK